MNYPDGTKGIFGYTTNTNNLVSYSQKELTDLWGNQISFIYSFSDNSDVISRIYYTGGVIEFEYEFYNRMKDEICIKATSKHCFIQNGRPTSLKKYLPESDIAMRKLLENKE